MKKYGYWLLCSVVFLAILLLCCLKTDIETVEEQPLAFSVEQDDATTEIALHLSENGKYYVFLPSYAELSALKIVMLTDSEVSLGAAVVSNGMYCGEFALETAYPLTVDGKYLGELFFCRSANVAAMYVDTVSGSMVRIRKDKNRFEQADVKLYTADGILNVSDASAYIKGRGNFTWDYYSKRPYLLTLSADADVLGMGAATKWILLANATDPTHLKNKLVLDLARQTGKSWSPECRYVDVYLNGEYAGLYLLTEKVEAGTSRLSQDPQSGDFLGKIDLESRWSSLKNPIRTHLGRTVEIGSPDPLDERSRTNVLTAVNQMEQIIMSGSDLSQTENFDLDSWIQRYLIDEISGNIDADMVSSYFYFQDGVYYAGPVWDYDMTFGNAPRNRDPVSFVAKNPYKIDDSVSYYDALYANRSFYERMVERYRSEFLPLLNQLIRSGISDLAAQIEGAARMDALRWPGTVAGLEDDTVFTAEDLIAYLEDRVSFLNSAWLEGTEYCTLQFKVPGMDEYWNVSVRKGQLLLTDHLDLENTVWVDKATGSAVDFHQPIVSDGILVQLDEFGRQNKSIDRTFLDSCVIILSAVIFAVFFFCMVCVDVSGRRRERRAANEQRKTHVSS